MSATAAATTAAKPATKGTTAETPAATNSGPLFSIDEAIGTSVDCKILQNRYETIEGAISAAEKGELGAQFLLATMYRNGLYIAQTKSIADPDFNASRRWHVEAAKQGFMPSRYAIAVFTLKGLAGYKADRKIGLELMQKLSDDGYGHASVDLGKFQLKSAEECEREKLLDQKKACEEQAVEYFRLGLKQGSALAFHFMGCAYLKACWGVERNIPEGLKDLQVAANAGELQSKFSLAKFYSGSFEEIDGKKMALNYYLELAEMGCSEAIQEYNKLRDIFVHNKWDLSKKMLIPLTPATTVSGANVVAPGAWINYKIYEIDSTTGGIVDRPLYIHYIPFEMQPLSGATPTKTKTGTKTGTGTGTPEASKFAGATATASTAAASTAASAGAKAEAATRPSVVLNQFEKSKPSQPPAKASSGAAISSAQTAASVSTKASTPVASPSAVSPSAPVVVSTVASVSSDGLASTAAAAPRVPSSTPASSDRDAWTMIELSEVVTEVVGPEASSANGTKKQTKPKNS